MESTILHYKGYHGCPSQCRLTIHTSDSGDVVAVASELDDNPGTSVTNMIEVIASMVAERLKNSNFLMVEHYPPRKHITRSHPTGDWDIVTFYEPKFRSPRWCRTTPEELLERYAVNVID